MTRLVEAIKTAEIDLVLQKHIRAGILMLGETIVKNYTRYVPEGPDAHDRLLRYFEENRKALMGSVGKVLNMTLTDVFRHFANQRFGGDNSDLNALVFYQNEGETAYSGEYDFERKMIMVYVPREHFFNAGLSAIDMAFVEEEFEPILDVLVKEVAAIFIHEYVHFEQTARGMPFDNDFGYTRNGKHGRGGLRRNPDDLAVYLGSASEIEAFAADTAADLIARLRSSGRPLDDIVSEVRSAIANGHANAGAALYAKFLRSAFEKRVAVDASEAVIVWRRFIKKVMEKLDDYVGREARDSHPTSWKRAAERYPMAGVLAWLAGQVAGGYDMARGEHTLLNKAEDFIADVYGPKLGDRSYAATLRVFRNMVDKRLDAAYAKIRAEKSEGSAF